MSLPGVSTETIDVIDVIASPLAPATAGCQRDLPRPPGVERMPHLADDPMRVLKLLPGVAGGDFSAALNIRGGRREEALLTIDGAEIHNAFHFRDLDGAMSVLDTSLVEGIDFMTGGMTADVGDYMSGVVAMQTRRPSPADDYSSGVGISFVSALWPHFRNFLGRPRLVAGLGPARISRCVDRAPGRGRRAAHAALHGRIRGRPASTSANAPRSRRVSC